jgi:hypothetical protein
MNRVLRVIRNQFNKKLVGLEVQVANRTALSLPQLAELIKEKLNEWNAVKLTLENELEPGFNLIQFEVETLGLKRAADIEKNDFQKIDQSNFVVTSPHRSTSSMKTTTSLTWKTSKRPSRSSSKRRTHTSSRRS